MKVALIHDYIKEYGGAERVLEALAELYPEAPIYTAFYKKDSYAYQQLKSRVIKPSWVHFIPFFSSYLHSPLRFLAPLVWGSFKKELMQYDVVISSASWYVTKGFGSRRVSSNQLAVSSSPIEVCYCHTPPRWLYGYKTSIEFQKYWPVRVYAAIVGHFMRMYDFTAAQKVNYFIANSRETAARIKKFYRRDATVIYPPVSLPQQLSSNTSQSSSRKRGSTILSQAENDNKKEEYFFILARIVGGKGLDLAVEAAVKGGFNLKIAGVAAGYYTEHKKLEKLAQKNVEFLGHVTDEELIQLYSQAKAFLALATDEDFGITPVESMLCGTPVVAFYGGGYKESVVEGKTGLFFHELSVNALLSTIQKFDTIKWSRQACIKQAALFSKERFQKEIQTFVKKAYESSTAYQKN